MSKQKNLSTESSRLSESPQLKSIQSRKKRKAVIFDLDQTVFRNDEQYVGGEKSRWQAFFKILHLAGIRVLTATSKPLLIRSSRHALSQDEEAIKNGGFFQLNTPFRKKYPTARTLLIAFGITDEWDKKKKGLLSWGENKDQEAVFGFLAESRDAYVIFKSGGTGKNKAIADSSRELKIKYENIHLVDNSRSTYTEAKKLLPPENVHHVPYSMHGDYSVKILSDEEVTIQDKKGQSSTSNTSPEKIDPGVLYVERIFEGGIARENIIELRVFWLGANEKEEELTLSPADLKNYSKNSCWNTLDSGEYFGVYDTDPLINACNKKLGAQPGAEYFKPLPVEQCETATIAFMQSLLTRLDINIDHYPKQRRIITTRRGEPTTNKIYVNKKEPEVKDTFKKHQVTLENSAFSLWAHKTRKDHLGNVVAVESALQTAPINGKDHLIFKTDALCAQAELDIGERNGAKLFAFYKDLLGSKPAATQNPAPSAEPAPFSGVVTTLPPLSPATDLTAQVQTIFKEVKLEYQKSRSARWIFDSGLDRLMHLENLLGLSPAEPTQASAQPQTTQPSTQAPTASIVAATGVISPDQNQLDSLLAIAMTLYYGTARDESITSGVSRMQEASLRMLLAKKVFGKRFSVGELQAKVDNISFIGFLAEVERAVKWQFLFNEFREVKSAQGLLNSETKLNEWLNNKVIQQSALIDELSELPVNASPEEADLQRKRWLLPEVLNLCFTEHGYEALYQNSCSLNMSSTATVSGTSDETKTETTITPAGLQQSLLRTHLQTACQTVLSNRELISENGKQDLIKRKFKPDSKSESKEMSLSEVFANQDDCEAINALMTFLTQFDKVFVKYRDRLNGQGKPGEKYALEPDAPTVTYSCLNPRGFFSGRGLTSEQAECYRVGLRLRSMRLLENLQTQQSTLTAELH